MDGFTLSDVTDRFADEFSQHSDWLKFGFHAIDAAAYQDLSPEREKEYYEKTIKELVRITGSERCIDQFVRLDRYTANRETVNSLQRAGVIGLLITESRYMKNGSYALTYEEMAACYKEDWYIDADGMIYTPTDMNLESIDCDSEFYKMLKEIAPQPRMIVFTHEWILDDRQVKKYMTWMAQFMHDRGILFDFPQKEAER